MSGFGADRSEAEAFFAANPDTAFVETMFTPLSGVTRGKRLRRSELAKVYEGGAFVPSSIVAVDILGADCEASGLVWETATPTTCWCLFPAAWSARRGSGSTSRN